MGKVTHLPNKNVRKFLNVQFSFLGRVTPYKCEKCGKEKIEYKYNSDINSDYWNI